MMKDYLLFKKMLTPALVQVFFWLTVIASLVGGITQIIQGAWAHGLQMIFLVPLGMRILSEFLLVAFRIQERLEKQ